MEFQVLGPLVVRDDAGSAVPLPREKQRVLLSVLLLDRGRVVPSSRLIDVLWPDGAPSTATTALHGHISALRKLLGRERVQTRAPGYVLVAASDEVDLGRFDALLADARARADAAERAEILGSALALWRGAPLADLASHPFVHAELERLAELRLAALEERIAAELDSGHGAELVPELEALAAEHPFRERLRALLMRSLYRGGRQADALAVYRSLRELLVEELGIEPSVELQRLERQILNQEAALARPSTAALPSGTVTFVFTDVERSTELLHALGNDEYAETLAQHRELLRGAFAAHEGVEVDTQGDGFFFAFARAADAVAAAKDAQRAHLTAPMRVRIGIHTGEPVVTAEGYVGADVHRAARIAALGHGGQTLLSRATKELVPDAAVRDLGEHRLKGFRERERIWQLGAAEFPTLRSIGRANLPSAAPVLFGRERELAAIAALVRSGVTLITLTGPGGAGKTQLGLHAARAFADAFDDGVYFVDLAPLADVELVRPTMAHALELREPELDEALLHGRRLLVLDNAEHLAGVGEVIAPYLSGTTTFLITSRALLNVRFEQQFQVEPLEGDAAAELFVARAASAGRTIANDATVREICDRLDNLPLALELAAVRTKLVEPTELLQRLGRDDALAAAPADAPDRQRTLRSTIAWSFDLLEPNERAAFAALSIFSGGWTLDAAESVCAIDLATLGSLVDRNLVRRVSGRFTMLETIRDYAREQLEASGRLEQAARAHAACYVELAERAAAEIASSEQRAALRRLDLDLDNLRAALAWSEEHDFETLARLVAALGRFWTGRGLFAEARRWLGAVLARGEPASENGVESVLRAGHFARHDGDHGAARALYAQGLALAEQIGSQLLIARSLVLLGQIDLLEGDVGPARGRLERGQALFEEAGDVRMTAIAELNLGAVEIEAADDRRAHELIACATDRLRAIGDELTLAGALSALACAEARDGRREEARALWRDGLRLAVDLEAWPVATWTLIAAAYVESETAPAEAARWLGAAERAYAVQGLAWERTEARVRDAAAVVLSARLGERWHEEHAVGRGLTLEQAVNSALATADSGLVTAGTT